MCEEPKFTKYVIIFVAILWIFFAIFFGVFDLIISIQVVDSDSNWAYFVEKFGELPGYLTILLAVFLYKMERRDNRKKIELFYTTIWFFVLLFLIYSITERILKDQIFYVTYRYVIIFIISFIIVIFERITNIEGYLNVQPYTVFSRITLILAILNPLLFVQTVKILWGRVRFRNLTTGYSDYTPWYLPQGITGHRSFPSGHAAMGWMLLPLTLFLDSRSRRVKFLISILIVSWGLFVALGRVVIGAHYASDVLFSSTFGVLSFFLSYRYFKILPLSKSQKREKQTKHVNYPENH